MVDPITAIGTGLGILGSKDILNKLLGPTADYIGGEIKNLVAKCNINVSDIFVRAYRKLGNKINDDGVVPPRVLKGVLNEGSFCEDEISKEYFAGVLASSRSEDGKDDRGVTFVNLVSGLSSHQIRTHYLFYSALRKLFSPLFNTLSPGTDRRAMMLYIPTASYFEAMSLNQDISFLNYGLTILSHSMNGLRRADLIEDQYVFGDQSNFLNDVWQYRFPQFPIDQKILREHGIAFQPTPGGMELFLWVHGLGEYSHFNFLDDDLTFDPIENVKLLKDVNILYLDYVQHKQTGIRRG